MNWSLSKFFGIFGVPSSHAPPHISVQFEFVYYLPPSFYDTLTPQDSLELKEPDAIYYDTVNDNMRYIDMDCGDNQSIPKYESFYDVPASTDSIIIVDDILYRRGREKWIPVYPDEYVMWISSNGDTIWE